ncbi:RES family NAD+ phosphorylase [Achromobacter sp. 413638]|uniref:RES family NAD+ phosphorylase n=1 Tax=Achromobacter sp. 413638 TaxID=3342385 RepID=UPI00370A08FC
MIALWRLSNSQDLRPRGRPPGRWHGPGAPVVVLDASPAAAVFARLAQAEVAHPRALPRHYFLLEVVAPESAVQDSDAPANWLTDLQATRALGNAWLARGETALLRVPSAAGGLQYLLNAEHPQLAQCQIVSALAYPYLPHLTGLDSAVLDGAGWLVTARPGE